MTRLSIASALLITFGAASAHAQATAGGPYQLKNGSECIASTSMTGDDLVVAACDAMAENQLFYLDARASSTFAVRSEANGGVFDVTASSTEAGTALLSWPSNGQDNQRFAFNARGAAYELRPAHATDRCVAAEADDSVKLAACDSGAAAQAWELVAVDVPTPDNPRDCEDDELYRPRFVENGQGGPTGGNVVIMTGGYMMLLWAVDSGKTPGILEFFDVSDPRNPVSVNRIDDDNTAHFREAHSMPVGMVGDKEYVAIQTVDGIQFWDISDPLNASFASEVDLTGEGIQGGDYDNVAWQAEWHGRTLFLAGANQGLYVIDAADPLNPMFVRKVPTGDTGGFRIGPLLARGSSLVVGSMESDLAYAVLDITVPDMPAVMSTHREAIKLYSMTASADRIYGSGREGDFTIHSFEDPTDIVPISTTVITQDSLYVAAQDHFVFSGRQNNFVKLDVSDEQNVEIVGEGTVGRDGSDHGQVTPLGNWIFIGNDHGTGNAFFCHAVTDDLPLAVQKIFPSDNATQQDPMSTISIVFSDYVDTTTVSQSTVAIRPGGGEPLEGIYTYNFNTLHFSPSEPFAANTTYEIALQADGVKDVSGNPLGEEVIARFSTGDTVVVPPPPDPPVTGGSGGMGGAGGASAGGAGGGAAAGSGGAGAGAGGMSAGTGAGAAGMTGQGGMAGAGAGGTGASSPAPSGSDSGGCSVAAGARAARPALLVPMLIAALWLLRRRARSRTVA